MIVLENGSLRVYISITILSPYYTILSPYYHYIILYYIDLYIVMSWLLATCYLYLGFLDCLIIIEVVAYYLPHHINLHMFHKSHNPQTPILSFILSPFISAGISVTYFLLVLFFTFFTCFIFIFYLFYCFI